MNWKPQHVIEWRSSIIGNTSGSVILSESQSQLLTNGRQLIAYGTYDVASVQRRYQNSQYVGVMDTEMHMSTIAYSTQ